MEEPGAGRPSAEGGSPPERRGPSADRVLGVVCLALVLGLWGLARGVPDASFARTLSPRFFPQLLALALLVPALALIVRPRSEALGARAARLLRPRTGVFVALVLAYGLLFAQVDFRLLTWGFVLGAMLALGARRPLELALFPPAVALAAWALFRHGLGVLLPQWTP